MKYNLTMRIVKSVYFRAKYFIMGWRRNYLDRRELPISVATVNNDLFWGNSDTDISDHLNTIYAVAMAKKPKVILELGTRGGESTRVLSHVAEKFNGRGYSVDLSEAPDWLNNRSDWKHVVFDDTKFPQEISRNWPDGSAFAGVDLLFLDTSHFYEHTLEELQLYWDLINPDGVLILHDTNCTEKVTRRLSGKTNRGWDNSRGVIRAVEEFFECEIDESNLISLESLGKSAKGLTHYPWNNGITLVFK